MKKSVTTLVFTAIFALSACVASADSGELAVLFEKDFSEAATDGDLIFDVDSMGWSTSSNAWSFYTGYSMPANSPMILHKSSESVLNGLAGNNPVAVYNGDVGKVFKVSGNFTSVSASNVSLWFNAVCDKGEKPKSGFRFEYTSDGTLSLKYSDAETEYTLCETTGTVNYKWIVTSFELACSDGKVEFAFYNAYSKVKTPQLDLAALCLENGILSYNASGKIAFTATDVQNEITVLKKVKIEAEKAYAVVTNADVGESSVSVNAKYRLPDGEKANALCAVYDGTGALVGLETKTVLSGSGELSFNVAPKGLGAPAYVKVFLNGTADFLPLCPSAEYSIDGGESS